MTRWFLRLGNEISWLESVSEILYVTFFLLFVFFFHFFFFSPHSFDSSTSRRREAPSCLPFLSHFQSFLSPFSLVRFILSLKTRSAAPIRIFSILNKRKSFSRLLAPIIINNNSFFFLEFSPPLSDARRMPQILEYYSHGRRTLNFPTHFSLSCVSSSLSLLALSPPLPLSPIFLTFFLSPFTFSLHFHILYIYIYHFFIVFHLNSFQWKLVPRICYIFLFVYNA